MDIRQGNKEEKLLILNSHPSVKFCDIHKSFFLSQALENVSFSIFPGTIHAIVGENGAGKSTLLKILYGIHQPDAGHIYVYGQRSTFLSSKDAINLGIGMVSQEHTIIPELTNLENIILGQEKSFWLDPELYLKKIYKLSADLNFNFNPHGRASSLSPIELQKLEVLKLLWRNSKIMIFDEPTAFMTVEDAKNFYSNMKVLARKGHTIIVATHKLLEVETYVDNVTVLRSGRVVLNGSVAEFNSDTLAQEIIGHEVSVHKEYHPKLENKILNINSVGWIKNQKKVLNDVCLNVYKGDVIGIAGVEGSGQLELFKMLAGIVYPTIGSIYLEDEDITTKSLWDRKNLGLRYIGPDRNKDGMIQDFNVIENAQLGCQRYHKVYRKGFMKYTESIRLAKQFLSTFDVKINSTRSKMSHLSGGNLQRFVNAKAFCYNPKMIVAFQPSRGLDLDAIDTFYEKLYGVVKSGAGAIIFSYDLDELTMFCNKVLVMYQGKLIEPNSKNQKNKKYLGKLMTGLDV